MKNDYVSNEHKKMLLSFLSKDRIVDSVLALYDVEWSGLVTAEEQEILRKARYILRAQTDKMQK